MRGSAWSAGPADPGPAPFSAPFSPSTSGIPPRPTATRLALCAAQPDFSLPHPHSYGLTSDLYSLPSRPTSSVILSLPILMPPNPTLPRASSVSVRVLMSGGLRSHQVGFYQPLF